MTPTKINFNHFIDFVHLKKKKIDIISKYFKVLDYEDLLKFSPE